MEYKCEKCGDTATVHITKIVQGQKTKIHLCEKCATSASNMVESIFPPELFPKMKELEKQIMGNIIKGNSSGETCKSCDMTFPQFEKGGRFSCPECYVTFKENIKEFLKGMHGATKHIGKKPSKISVFSKNKSTNNTKVLKDIKVLPHNNEKFVEKTTPKTIEDLNAELSIAISEERYEDAAIIRDEIKSLSIVK